MANVSFDFSAFFSAIDHAREKRGSSWKKLADDVGMSASSLTRLQQGKKVDVNALGSLAQWANLEVDSFYDPAPRTGVKDPEEEIVALLRADSKLTDEESSMLQRVIRAAYSNERKSP